MSTKPSFFEIFKGIVDHSGLTFYAIAKRMQERSVGTEVALLPPVHRTTINRIYRGIDLPNAFLLYRIAKYGLDQNKQQCDILERLRGYEALSHTTSHHKVVAKTPDTDALPHVEPAKVRRL